MTYGEPAGVGCAGDVTLKAPFASAVLVPACGKHPQLKTMPAFAAGAYENPPPYVPPVATCMPIACSTGDGTGEGLGPRLGDGRGPGPGRVEPPPPPQPAISVAVSTAAALTAPTYCMLFMN